MKSERDRLINSVSRRILSFLKDREKYGKVFRHPVFVVNSILKREGVRKDIRREAWKVLLESGLILSYKEGVWLKESIITMTQEQRKKILPPPIFCQFMEEVDEFYRFKPKTFSCSTEDILHSKYEREVNHPLYGDGEVVSFCGDKAIVEFADKNKKILKKKVLSSSTLVVGTIINHYIYGEGIMIKDLGEEIKVRFKTGEEHCFLKKAVKAFSKREE